MEEVLIDTDVFIDFLRGFHLRIKPLFEKVQNREIIASVSVITLIELYSGKTINRDKPIIVQFLSFFKIIPVEIELFELAGKIKRSNNLIIADAIIAATSIQKGTKLCTFNIKNFAPVPGIKLYSLQSD